MSVQQHSGFFLLYYANTWQVICVYAIYATVINMHRYCQKRNTNKKYATRPLKICALLLWNVENTAGFFLKK